MKTSNSSRLDHRNDEKRGILPVQNSGDECWDLMSLRKEKYNANQPHPLGAMGRDIAGYSCKEQEVLPLGTKDCLPVQYRCRTEKVI